MAEAAYVLVGKIISVHDEMSGALMAGGGGEHSGVKELHQAPGAGQRQHHLDAARTGLLQVQLVALDLSMYW